MLDTVGCRGDDDNTKVAGQIAPFGAMLKRQSGP
jgi:hypothetical protein